MRKVHLWIALVVLALALFFYWNRKWDIKYAPSQPGLVVVLGDSIGTGYGLEDGQAYPDLLRVRLGIDLINASVSGNRTTDALERMDADVLSLDPAVVIIEVGGNDLLRRMKREETEKNIRSIVEKAHAKQIAVVLIGVDGPLGVGVDGLYKDLARELGTGYVKNIIAGVFGIKELMVDQIHPNAEGQKIIAERVEKALRDQLPGLVGQ